MSTRRQPRDRPVPIPDHDGPPIPGLGAALDEIDRRFRESPWRRFLRAAACYDHGDDLGWHREMRMGMEEFADWHGLTQLEAARLVLPSRRFVEQRLSGGDRPSGRGRRGGGRRA